MTKNTPAPIFPSQYLWTQYLHRNDAELLFSRLAARACLFRFINTLFPCLYSSTILYLSFHNKKRLAYSCYSRVNINSAHDDLPKKVLMNLKVQKNAPSAQTSIHHTRIKKFSLEPTLHFFPKTSKIHKLSNNTSTVKLGDYLFCHFEIFTMLQWTTHSFSELSLWIFQKKKPVFYVLLEKNQLFVDQKNRRIKTSTSQYFKLGEVFSFNPPNIKWLQKSYDKQKNEQYIWTEKTLFFDSPIR